MKITNYELVLENDRNVLAELSCIEYKNNIMNEPEKIDDLFRNEYKLSVLAEEKFYMIALNTKGKVLGVFELANGTVNYCLINIRGLLIRALLIGAVNIITIHNHPSGDTTPSKEDINCSKRIKEACSLVQLNLIDNIIIGNESYLSFKEENLL